MKSVSETTDDAFVSLKAEFDSALFFFGYSVLV